MCLDDSSRIRTCDRSLRRRMLYPAELWNRSSPTILKQLFYNVKALKKVLTKKEHYIILINVLFWSVGQGVKTPPFHGGNTGSNPVRTIESAIAQLVERMTVNHDVTGSSPVGGVTKIPLHLEWYFLLFIAIF